MRSAWKWPGWVPNTLALKSMGKCSKVESFLEATVIRVE